VTAFRRVSQPESSRALSSSGLALEAATDSVSGRALGRGLAPRPFVLLLFTQVLSEKVLSPNRAIVGTEGCGWQIYSAGVAHDDRVLATVLLGKPLPS
jgi:hypothetical protein